MPDPTQPDTPLQANTPAAAPADYSQASAALGGGGVAQNFQDAGDQTQAIQAGTQNAPLNTRQAPPDPSQQVAKPKASFMSDVLKAVAEVLGGPSTRQQVDPQTGQIQTVPLTRSERIANTAGIYMRGIAAGAAQHGPGAVGKAALAGAQEQQQTQQQQNENTMAESQNVRATLMNQASLAKMSQDQARTALDMKAFGMQLDANQVAIANSLQGVLNMPGVKLLQHFDSNSGINDHLVGEHAKLWGDHAAAATWSGSAIGRKPWCQCRKAFSKVPFST